MVFLGVIELWWGTIMSVKLIYQMEGDILYLAD